MKNNLDLLTVDVEGGLKSEDLLGKIPEGFNLSDLQQIRWQSVPFHKHLLKLP